VANKTQVRDGDRVTIVQPDAGGFTMVRASNGTTGYIKSQYVSAGGRPTSAARPASAGGLYGGHAASRPAASSGYGAQYGSHYGAAQHASHYGANHYGANHYGANHYGSHCGSQGQYASHFNQPSAGGIARTAIRYPRL